MNRQLKRICVIALAAGLSCLGIGCETQQATQPEVEWMLPNDAHMEVVEAPGLGASDALGNEIFVRHEERLAQAQLVRVLAAADSGTLWIDQVPGYGSSAGVLAGFDPFFDRPFYDDAPGEPTPSVITEAEGSAIHGAVNE